METKEKVNNVDIEDGKFIQISNLGVIFYYEKPQQSFNIFLEYLRGISKIVLGRDTKENSPDEIVREIVDAVKKNPDIFYLAAIVYNTENEKKYIMSSIIKGLGLNENEVFKNLKRQTNG
jgi:hypothetical protein